MSDAPLSADIQLIPRILPHRYPFLLVDRVGMPIMPGVTIVEAMAQTAAVMVGVALDMADTDLKIYFMSIDKCKFRRKVIPGDQLIMKLETLRGKPGGKVWKFAGVAEVEGEMAAEAEFTAMMDLSA